MKKLLLAGAAVVVVLFVGSLVLSFASLAFNVIEIAAVAAVVVGGYRVIKGRSSKRLGSSHTPRSLR